MIAARVLVFVGMSALVPLSGADALRKSMNAQSGYKQNLAHLIATASQEQAELLAARMPPADVGDVLRQTADSEKASARSLVLRLASKYPSEGASEAILSRLTDADLSLRSIAGSLIAMIAQKSLVPQMLKLTERDELDVRVKGALVRQIGMIGDAGDIPPLQTKSHITSDPGLKRDLSAALARLGDRPSRQELINRLSDPRLHARLEALDDAVYVGDKQLAQYFRPALSDRRDATVISFPHEPVVWARVCDLAIAKLSALGLSLPFPTAPTRRFTEEEIALADRVVAQLAGE